jgi:hypothetical protein
MSGATVPLSWRVTSLLPARVPTERARSDFGPAGEGPNRFSSAPCPLHHPHDIINVIVFFLTSIIIGQLVKITKRQNLLLQLRIRRITLIEEMSKEFLMLPPVEQFVGGLIPAFKIPFWVVLSAQARSRWVR